MNALNNLTGSPGYDDGTAVIKGLKSVNTKLICKYKRHLNSNMKLKYHRRRSNFEYTNITGRALYTNDIGLNSVQASLRTDLWKVNGIWYFLLDGIIYKIRNDQYIEVGHCDGGRITTLDTGYLCTTTSEDYTTWWYKIYDAEDHLVSELALESCTKIGYDANFIYFKCHGRVYLTYDRANFQLNEIPLGNSNIFNYLVINDNNGCFSGDAGLIFWDFVQAKSANAHQFKI